MSRFIHFDLILLNPSFYSPLVDVLTELELLRHLRLEADIHPLLFVQVRAIFHMLEWKSCGLLVSYPRSDSLLEGRGLHTRAVMISQCQ